MRNSASTTCSGTRSRSPSPRPSRLGAVCTTPLPPNLSQAELEKYAAACGEQAASEYVLRETGIDPRTYVSGGKVDWKKAAGAVSTYYVGLDPTGVIRPDGSIDWKEANKEAAGFAAASACTAYGAGAIAPLCSKIGSSIGGALYDLGATVIDLISGSKPLPIPSPTDRINALVGEIRLSQTGPATIERHRLIRTMALRAMAIGSYSTILRLQKAWAIGTGRAISLDQAKAKLLGFGWSAPPGLDHAGGPKLTFGGWPPDNYTVFDLAGLVFKQEVKPDTGLDKYLGKFVPVSIRVYPIVEKTPGPGYYVDWAGVRDFKPGEAQAALSYAQGRDPAPFGVNGGAIYVYSDPQLDAWVKATEGPLIDAFDLYRNKWAMSLETASRKFLREIAAKRRIAFGLEVAPSGGLGLFGWTALIGALGLSYLGYRAYKEGRI